MFWYVISSSVCNHRFCPIAIDSDQYWMTRILNSLYDYKCCHLLQRIFHPAVSLILTDIYIYFIHLACKLSKFLFISWHYLYSTSRSLSLACFFSPLGFLVYSFKFGSSSYLNNALHHFFSYQEKINAPCQIMFIFPDILVCYLIRHSLKLLPLHAQLDILFRKKSKNIKLK